jgi:hypothetical protein
MMKTMLGRRPASGAGAGWAEAVPRPAETAAAARVSELRKVRRFRVGREDLGVRILEFENA